MNPILGQTVESVLLSEYHVGISVPNGNPSDHLAALSYGNYHGYNTTGVLFPIADISNDTHWNISNWSAYDHTNQQPDANHSFDQVVRQHYLDGKRIRVMIPIGRQWSELNGQPGISQFYSPSDVHMRVDGITPTYQDTYGIVRDACPSLAAAAVQNYAKELLYRFFKRYLAAINDGIILSVGFGTEANAEAQLPYQFKNSDGSDGNGAKPKGDFNIAAITRFKQIFPQYTGVDNNSIANASLTTDLGRDFWWHEADMLRNIEWIAIDYMKSQLGSALTRSRFWSVDVGSYADPLSDTRRTYNIQARANRSEYLLIKTNDDPSRPYAVDYARSAAVSISGIPYYEPSPAQGNPSINPFVEFKAITTAATQRAKNEGFSISLLVTPDLNYTYNVAQDAGAIGLSSPVVPTSVVNVALNLSAIIAGGWGYIENQWTTARTASGKEYVNFTVVDDVKPTSTCTTSPPVLSASPATVSPNDNHSELSATGCSGTVHWANGLGDGNTKQVYPTTTTTYSATCEANGCTSSSSYVTVNVPSSGNCNTMEGFFDTADCSTLSGWIYDASQPNIPISIDLYEGSTPIQTSMIANNFRQDLVDAGKGNGNHAFSIATPSNLKNGQNRTINFRVSGCTYTLNNSPRTINCTSCSTPPNPPTVSSSSTTSPSELSASGCNGTVNWSHGATGVNITATPTTTTTYTATCTVDNCTSTNSNSVTVSVSNVNCNGLEGFFDGAYCGITGVSGWIYNANQPNAPISVDIYEGNNLVQGNILANNFRQDLQDAGKGNGQHAFSVPMPSSLKDGQNHALSIRVSGCAYTLNNSPRTANCSPGSRLSGEEKEGVESKTDLTVSPNPNLGEFNVSFYVGISRKAKLVINDMLGRQVWEKSIIGAGEHHEKVRLPEQSIGAYILTLHKETATFVDKSEFKKVLVVK